MRFASRLFICVCGGGELRGRYMYMFDNNTGARPAQLGLRALW
jgi:hypothetical protein